MAKTDKDPEPFAPQENHQVNPEHEPVPHADESAPEQ